MTNITTAGYLLEIVAPVLHTSLQTLREKSHDRQLLPQQIYGPPIDTAAYVSVSKQFEKAFLRHFKLAEVGNRGYIRHGSSEQGDGLSKPQS